jgi:hypothetical protein
MKTETRQRGRRRLVIARSVLGQIRATVGGLPAEHGGPLGGSRADGVVRAFHFDDTARQSGAAYSPDHERLNRLFAREWNPAGVNFLGFVHSHPPRLRRLSRGDLEYAERILDAIPELDRLLLPLVQTEPDTGRFELIPYAVVRDRDGLRVERLDLEVLDDDQDEATVPAPTRVETANGTAVAVTEAPAAPAPAVSFAGGGALAETFRRVRTAYDLGRLAACRVIHVGTGGGADFIEQLARAGVGEHVLLDPDVVGETNLATQQVYRRDLGRRKVDCLAERLRDINPQAAVVALPCSLDDVKDTDFERLAAAPLRVWEVTASRLWGVEGNDVPVRVSLPPALTLLCGLTDNFEAQARVNRLALHFGLPSLCAQVYPEGRGAEVTFTYPGVTPACHRCALSSRYKAYLADGYRNRVTSDGTPIFATARLNALKGFLALALLHHGSDHPRWGGLLARIGARNLVQVRMDPDLPLGVFDRVFGGGDRERILFDDVVWLPQKPDGPATGFPACPDCGGTGDLCQARGTFADTRPMRR